VTGGGFHFPLSTSDFGAYSRIVRLKGPFGANKVLEKDAEKNAKKLIVKGRLRLSSRRSR
jgi:hypothetical protein